MKSGCEVLVEDLLQSYCSPSLTPGCNLPQVVHQIQIGKRATVFVDVIVAVGSDEDGANVGHAGDVWRNQLLPKLFVAAGQVQPVDRGRDFAEPVDEQRAAVASP